MNTNTSPWLGTLDRLRSTSQPTTEHVSPVGSFRLVRLCGQGVQPVHWDPIGGRAPAVTREDLA